MVDLLPTLPGKASGIVGWNPVILQCGQCGATVTQNTTSVGAFIILSRYHFHLCEGRNGIRRCPDCLAAVIAACPNLRCKHV